MRLFTIQVGKWRLAKDRNIRFMDTTVKSGYSLFAPTWEMVLGHKNGVISDSDYSRLYRNLLLKSWKDRRDEWMSFLNDDDIYALACYCKAGNFCHRHLLVKFLKQLCQQLELPFEYYGELTDVPSHVSKDHAEHIPARPSGQSSSETKGNDPTSTDG